MKSLGVFGGQLEKKHLIEEIIQYMIGRIEHGFNVRPDLCQVDNPINPREYLGKFYVDSINHDPKAFQYNIDLLGVDSIMLGTDYPFPLGELEPGKLIEGMPNLTDAERDRLLHGSALEWLGLNKEQFQ